MVPSKTDPDLFYESVQQQCIWCGENTPSPNESYCSEACRTEYRVEATRIKAAAELSHRPYEILKENY